MKTMRWLGLGFVILTLVVGFSGITPAWGQEVTAALTGTVVDASGAPILGASVSAKDMERGTLWPTKTNEAGIFSLPRIPVGTYELKVEMQGFKTEVHPPVNLVLDEKARVDFRMQVGQVTEMVEVSTTPPVLQTERTELATIIDSRTNDALPLATRNYVQLTLLAPGTAAPDPSTLKGDDVPYSSGGRPFVNGNREEADNFLLDGIDNNEFLNNAVGYSPSVDAIAEFNLITQNAPAEFGSFQGGIINASIKSGSNAFHGDVFEFFRNDYLNANEWYHGLVNPVTPKNKLRYNMFGATFGGPIVKNKLFFFADYQGQRFHHPSNTNPLVLFTSAERAGDFGSICTEGFTGSGICNNSAHQLFDPFNVVGGVRQPVPFNNFANTTDPIDMVAKNLFNSSAYPQVTGTDPKQPNFIDISHDLLRTDQGDLKVDYDASQKDHIFGRYTQMFQTQPFLNSWQLFGESTLDAPAKNVALGWTHVFNSRVVNDIRVGGNYVKIGSAHPSATSLGNFGQQLGINHANDHGPGLLSIGFSGAGYASSFGSSNVITHFGDALFQYGDALSISHGRHLFQTGFQYHRIRMNVFYPGTAGIDGYLSYTGEWTQQVVPAGPGCTPVPPATTCTNGNGLPEADFWLGLAQGSGRGDSAEWGHRANYFGAYFQDDWRATDSLTLNLGIRYEVQTPWVEIHDRQNNFGPFDGTVEYAGKNGNSRALYDGYYSKLAFQPRIGFAWTPGMLKKRTVFRGAYTVSTFTEGTGANLRLPQNPPFSPPSFTYTFVDTGSNLPNSTQCAASPCLTENALLAPAPNPDPTCATLSCFNGANINLWLKNFQPAVVQQWNLSIQQLLARQTTFQMGYVGQHGTHLASPLWMNQLQDSNSAAVCAAAGQPSAPCAVPGPYIAGNPTLKQEIGVILGTGATGIQHYDALQASLQQHFGGGLEAQVSYTYSKCLTDQNGFYSSWGGATQATQGSSSFWQNAYSRSGEYGTCFFDQKHALSAYAVYELPIGHGKRWGSDLSKAANGVVSNWTLSGILSIHTGFPLTIYDNNDFSNTNAAADRTNCSSHPHILNQKIQIGPGSAAIQWFDPTVFSDPAPYTFGTCGNGVVRGPSLKTFDMSAIKGIPLGESRKLEFRTEFINLTNTPILGSPNVRGPGGTLGDITTSQGARQIQFALKYYY